MGCDWWTYDLRPTIFLRLQQSVDNAQKKYAQVAAIEKSCPCDWFSTVGITSYELKLFYSCDCKFFWAATVSDCLKNIAGTLRLPMVLAHAQCDPEKSVANCFFFYARSTWGRLNGLVYSSHGSMWTLGKTLESDMRSKQSVLRGWEVLDLDLNSDFHVCLL